MSIPRPPFWSASFTDPLSLAERPDDVAATSVVDHLVRHLEDLAAAHRIEYLKIMSAEFVCSRIR